MNSINWACFSNEKNAPLSIRKTRFKLELRRNTDLKFWMRWTKDTGCKSYLYVHRIGNFFESWNIWSRRSNGSHPTWTNISNILIVFGKSLWIISQYLADIATSSAQNQCRFGSIARQFCSFFIFYLFNSVFGQYVVNFFVPKRQPCWVCRWCRLKTITNCWRG